MLKLRMNDYNRLQKKKQPLSTRAFITIRGFMAYSSQTCFQLFDSTALQESTAFRHQLYHKIAIIFCHDTAAKLTVLKKRVARNRKPQPVKALGDPTCSKKRLIHSTRLLYYCGLALTSTVKNFLLTPLTELVKATITYSDLMSVFKISIMVVVVTSSFLLQ